MIISSRALIPAAALVMLAGAALAAEPPAGARWEVSEVIGSAAPFSVLALDADGIPHIGYRPNDSYFEVHVAAGDREPWTNELAAATKESVYNRLTSVALAVDAGGRAHVAYFDPAAKELKYAFQRGGDWKYETVAREGKAGWYDSPALVWGGAGTAAPHLAYYDVGNRRVMYARRRGGRWTTEVVASDVYAGFQLGLALERAGGRPVVAYYDRSARALKIARRAGDKEEWTEEAAGVEGGGGEFFSFALDGRGSPRIAFYDEAAECLKYGSVTAENAWTTEVVDDHGRVGRGCALALDAQDRVLIAYYGSYELRCARGVPDGGWDIGAVAPAGSSRYSYAAAAFDASGRAHVAFYVGYNMEGSIYYARATDTAWPAVAGREPEPPHEYSDVNYSRLLGEPPAMVPLPEGTPYLIEKDRYTDKLYAEPGADDAAAAVEIPDGVSEFEVLDGRSIRKDNRISGQTGASYDSWLRVKAGAAEGWLDTPLTYYGEPEYLVYFTAPYAPLRERPSPQGPPLATENGDYAEGWRLGPAVPAGRLYALTARCDNWLCVGRPDAGGWLPLGARGLTAYYAALKWYVPQPEDPGSFEEWVIVYLPDRGDVDRIFYSFQVAPDSAFAWEDPVLAVNTAGCSFDVTPREVSRDLNAYGAGTVYFEALFPRTVPRGDITRVAFVFGRVGERVSFAADPVRGEEEE